MTVSDGDRFAVAMAKLSQARNAVYEATKIIEHLFEAGDPRLLEVCTPDQGLEDPSTGLYPGQKAMLPDYTDEDPNEPDVGIEEVVECVE